MNFKTRNMYYLRISEKSVLPVYVYLDERHLEWMSDQVLQHVLSDLRPRILPKLMAEADSFGNPAGAKKATVETYRGDTYQFCYFLRRMEPHSVVIKTRNFVARARKQPLLPPLSIINRSYKRKAPSSAKGASSSSVKKQRTKRSRAEVMEVDGSEASEGEIAPMTSKTPEMIGVTVIDKDEIMDDDEHRPEEEAESQERSDQEDDIQHDTLDLTLDEEEEKPKPVLQLKYKGFNIFGQCLCIVVEPWPALRSLGHAPQELGGISIQEAARTQNTSTVRNVTARAKAPLFLADDHDLDNEQPEPQPPKAVMNSWDGLEATDGSDGDDDSEFGGMMAFSQALNSAGDNRPGAADDEDEIDGAVLFGDADEARQL